MSLFSGILLCSTISIIVLLEHILLFGNSSPFLSKIFCLFLLIKFSDEVLLLIVLNLYVTLDKVDTSVILSLMIKEHNISPQKTFFCMCQESFLVFLIQILRLLDSLEFCCLCEEGFIIQFLLEFKIVTSCLNYIILPVFLSVIILYIFLLLFYQLEFSEMLNYSVIASIHVSCFSFNKTAFCFTMN